MINFLALAPGCDSAVDGGAPARPGEGGGVLYSCGAEFSTRSGLADPPPVHRLALRCGDGGAVAFDDIVTCLADGTSSDDALAAVLAPLNACAAAHAVCGPTPLDFAAERGRQQASAAPGGSYWGCEPLLARGTELRQTCAPGAAAVLARFKTAGGKTGQCP